MTVASPAGERLTTLAAKGRKTAAMFHGSSDARLPRRYPAHGWKQRGGRVGGVSVLTPCDTLV
jgi:hypothetical protein